MINSYPETHRLRAMTKRKNDTHNNETLSYIYNNIGVDHKF